VELINKNPKRNECAIVATFNALSWSGKPTNYKRIKRTAIEQFGFKSAVGTPSENISKMFCHFGVPFKRMKNYKTFLDVIDTLFKGKAVVILYNYKGQRMGHISMVTPKLQLVNPCKTITDWNVLSRSIMDDELDFSVWVLKGK
jgi:hypothetical protein